MFSSGRKNRNALPPKYGLFLASGEDTESVDVMQYLWTGNWPEHRCPQMTGAWLDGKAANQSVRLSPGQNYAAKVMVKSAPDARLSYSWEIMEESGAKTTGGDFEAPPQRLPGLVAQDAPGQAKVTAPGKPGAYRLFAYVRDGHGKAAYANIPFYVDAKLASVAAKP